MNTESNMNSQVAPWNTKELHIKAWLNSFEHWFRRAGKAETEKASLCRQLVGEEAEVVLQTVPGTAEYKVIAQVLRSKLGEFVPPLRIATPQGIAWLNESTGELMNKAEE